MWHVTPSADRLLRSLKAGVRALTGRTSAGSRHGADETHSDHERLGQLLHVRVAKHVFDRLDAFVCWRLSACCGNVTDGVGAISAAGSPPPPGGGFRSRRTGSNCSASHRSWSAATDTEPARFPTPNSLRTPSDGRDRGKPCCVERRTAGSTRGPENRTGSNPGTALQAYSAGGDHLGDTAGRSAHCRRR